jgi:uncharacterized membrane protein
MAGSHGHEHRSMPHSPGVRTVLTWVMVPLVVATVVSMVLLWPERPEPSEDPGGTFYEASVVEVHEQACPPEQEAAGFRRCGTVTVRMDEGPHAGQEIETIMPDGPGAPRVRVGDGVIMHAGFDPADPQVQRYDIADHQRDGPLLLLVALFAVAIVAFGRWRGVASLAGLASCFILLLTFVLPAIVAGSPPLLVAVVGAAMVMFVIMYLVHGVSVRTSVAILGTLGALVITGLLGYLGTGIAHLTGFVGTEERLLWSFDPDLDLRGVLLAGIIIGSLGVLDDVTVSQAATVGEIARADPQLSRRKLYLAGTRVGRAHIASVVNTLVLAYAGASLPLLLLIVATVGGRSATDIVTTESIAQEIVRSAVATVGLVAAVPLTTALAALVCATARAQPTRPPRGAPLDDDGPAGAGRGGEPPQARHRRVDHGEALSESPWSHRASSWSPPPESGSWSTPEAGSWSPPPESGSWPPPEAPGWPDDRDERGWR